VGDGCRQAATTNGDQRIRQRNQIGRRADQRQRLHNFQKPAVPIERTYGAVTFRCITYGAVTQAGLRVYSKLMLTGYQLHFIKIRMTGGRAKACSRPAPMPMPPCRLSFRIVALTAKAPSASG